MPSRQPSTRPRQRPRLQARRAGADAHWAADSDGARTPLRATTRSTQCASPTPATSEMMLPSPAAASVEMPSAACRFRTHQNYCEIKINLMKIFPNILTQFSFDFKTVLHFIN